MSAIDRDIVIKKYINPDIEKFNNSDVKIVLENLKQNILKMPSADEPREDSVSKRYLLAEIDDLADEFSEVDENGLHSERWCGIVDAKMVIMNAPVMVDEPQGEWILQENKHHIEKIYLCSNCRSFEAWGESEKYKYCPNCRARMKGANDAVDAV